MFCGRLTEKHSARKTGRRDGSKIEGEEVKGGILREEVWGNGSNTGVGVRVGREVG